MKAQLIPSHKEKSINWSNIDKKELIGGYHVTAIRKGKLIDPITVRFYMGRSSSASTVYAVIWASTDDRTLVGMDSAGGYGYCKKSAALAYAVGNAGIQLDKAIDGRGEGAMVDALTAIARDIHGCRGQVRVLSF